MKSREDIESYIMRLDLPYEEVGPNTWVVKSGMGVDNLVVSLAGPVVVFRCKIMDVPKTRREELFHTMLELNVSDLLHASYGVEGDSIVLGNALPLENLDFNEFQATVEDITLAVANHYSKLAKYRSPA